MHPRAPGSLQRATRGFRGASVRSSRIYSVAQLCRQNCSFQMDRFVELSHGLGVRTQCGAHALSQTHSLARSVTPGPPIQHPLASFVARSLVPLCLH
eukprot:13319407-Alexandrium_andersonii.AAC.1